MKLRTKIGLGVISGATFSVIGVILLIFTISKSQLQQSISDTQSETAHRAMDTIDQLFYERYLDIQVISTTPLLENLLAGQPQSKTETVHRLKEQTLLSGPWDILFAVDKVGAVVASSHSQLPKAASIAGQPHNQVAYQAAMRGEAYISELVTSDDTGRPTILFATPIRAEDK